MRMKIKTGLPILVALFLIGACSRIGVAQQQAPADVDSIAADSLPEAYIVLKAMSDGGRVVLRWTHSNSAAWAISRESGYRLERAVYDDDADIDEQPFQQVGSDIIRPWPLDRFTEEMVRENNLLGIVGQAVHGATFEVQASAGTMAGILQRAREMERRYVYSLWAADLDSASAEALGVRFVDDDVAEDETYVYRLSLATQDTLMEIRDAYVIVTAGRSAPLAAPEDFQVKEGDGAVELAWAKGLNSMIFSGFWVERSDDGGQTYSRVNEVPVSGSVGPLQGRYLLTDTTLVNYVEYHYRLYGISHFGTLSQPAELTAIPRDLSAPDAPVITNDEHIGGTTISLQWEMLEGSTIPSDFDGFYIGHSSQHGGPYEFEMDRALPSSTRRATDDRARANQLNYYVVAAVDTAGNASPSLPVLVQLSDSTPPLPPANLRLVSADDSTGQVLISWDRTGEEDLYAYRIYRKHHVDDPYVLRNDELRVDTTWSDTLNLRSPTKRVYYQVIALDYSYNESESSAELEVFLPDILPPVTPVFTQSVPSDTSVALGWARSPSFDVARQVLYRRMVADTRWDSLTTLSPADSAYIDYSVDKLKTYEYTIQVFDSTGLGSQLALPVKARVYDTGVRPAVSNFLVLADTAERVVHLSWDYEDPGDGEYWFVIYRGVGDAEPGRYRSTGTETTFDDHRVAFRSEDRYSYAIGVRFKNGAQSPLSPVISVAYPRTETSQN